jgi:hypothetical protein
VPRSFSKRLVIDADVAAQAGRKGDPISAACRQTLIESLTICHRAVMTAEIRGEWDRHQTMFAKIWLASMKSRRKLVERDVVPDKSLRAALAREAVSRYQEALMEKDIHLIESAAASDHVVVSRDEKARAAFNRHATALGITNLVWVNPTRPTDGCIQWLRAGARAEATRRLGTS